MNDGFPKVSFGNTSLSFVGRSWAASLVFAPNIAFPPSSFSPCFDCPDPSTGFVFSSSFLLDFDFAQGLTTCPGLGPEFEPPNLLVGREMSSETLSLIVSVKELKIMKYYFLYSVKLLVCSLPVNPVTLPFLISFHSKYDYEAMIMMIMATMMIKLKILVNSDQDKKK